MKQRLADGVTEEEHLLVVEEYCRRWAKDRKMREALTLSTLFGGKFAEYLAEARDVAKTRRTRAEVHGTEDPDAEGSLADPNDLPDLAAIEAACAKRGKPSPWARDPRRLAMTHDWHGKPIGPPPNGTAPSNGMASPGAGGA